MALTMCTLLSSQGPDAPPTPTAQSSHHQRGWKFTNRTRLRTTNQPFRSPPQRQRGTTLRRGEREHQPVPHPGRVAQLHPRIGVDQGAPHASTAGGRRGVQVRRKGPVQQAGDGLSQERCSTVAPRPAPFVHLRRRRRRRRHPCSSSRRDRPSPTSLSRVRRRHVRSGTRARTPVGSTGATMAGVTIPERRKPLTSMVRGSLVLLELSPAASYSPTRSPLQYHRR